MKRKPTRKKRKIRVTHGLFKICGLEINLNSILTTVFGSAACMLLAAVVTYVVSFNNKVQAIPKIQKDLKAVQWEQARVKREYHPPTNPTLDADQPK